MNKLLAITATFTLVFSLVTAIKFKDCGSELGKIVGIRISNCDDSSKVCLLKRFTNASIELDFEMVEDNVIDEVQTVVHGIVFGAETPFELEQPMACTGHGINCPLLRNETYKYAESLPVRAYYPPVSVTVKWELKDSKTDKTIICVLIPSKISLF